MAATKTFRTDCSISSEYESAPAVCVFTVHENMAQRIISLSEIVKNNNLYKIQEFDYSATFLKIDPEENLDLESVELEFNSIRTDCDCLNVTTQSFYFSANLNDSETEVSSASINISELVDFLAESKKEF